MILRGVLLKPALFSGLALPDPTVAVEMVSTPCSVESGAKLNASNPMQNRPSDVRSIFIRAPISNIGANMMQQGKQKVNFVKADKSCPDQNYILLYLA